MPWSSPRTCSPVRRRFSERLSKTESSVSKLLVAIDELTDKLNGLIAYIDGLRGR